MNKLSLSLFSRLYLSILSVIFVSITLTTFVMEIYYEQEELNFFIRDANYIFEQVSHHSDIEINTAQKRIELSVPFNRDFSAKVVNSNVEKKFCRSCQFIKKIKNINYYELEEGERLAEFRLPQSKNNLIIYEMLDSERIVKHDIGEKSDDEQEEYDEALFSLLILITSILMGIIIYLPIRKLQIQIKKLINSHYQFGLGNINIKADTNLQKPLDELAHSFNEMAQSIAKSVNERDIFSQAIPHEVRTPLSRIQLASGLIRKKTDNIEVLQLVDNVDNYVIDINDLINQIVEFSRINTYKSEELFDHYQSIEVKAFVNSRLSIFENKQKKVVTLEIEDSIELTTVPIYLRLLVDNFVKNALNHAQEKIQLSVSVVNDKFTLIVEDDGAGISPDDWDKIFIPFARLDKSRSRKTGGLGLGLAIAKAAARRMNGNIVVSKSKLGGAKFLFTNNV